MHRLFVDFFNFKASLKVEFASHIDGKKVPPDPDL